ncbi:HAD family phosphatase, partial [Candidatus Gracilibacteria bacterium]|nr:HAD family phosphatase [Candidatus Gracilibacteria bacterium]
AILFDFDGVIAHTQPIMKQVLWKFFSDKNIEIAEKEYEEDAWASKSLDQVCESLETNHNIILEVGELRKNIWEGQKALFSAGLESDPSLILLLEYAQKSNIPVAIGTNSARHRVEWVLELMKIDGYFRGIIGANDLTNHKPDPEVWLKCSEIVEVPLSECLVIEDGLPGLTGAKTCGARSVYYHRFCRPEKACMELAEKSVESFEELLS